jgi:tyrosinase
MNIRKSASALTTSEIKELIDSILEFKNNGNPNTSRNYDSYVKWHQEQAMPAHMSPQFLPWHRIFLSMMEKELQDVSGNPNLSIPYWDWRMDRTESSSLWDTNFLGGNGDKSDNWKVKTGPFASNSGQWSLIYNDANTDYLQRSFGDLTCELPTSRDVERVLNVSEYDVAPWNRQSDVNKSFRNRLEGWGIQSQLHNKGHVWVGGSMLEMTSPNDPVFFFHHCFIDFIWASWQNQHPNQSYATNSPDGTKEKLLPLNKPDGATYVVEDCLDWKALGFDYDLLLTNKNKAISKKNIDNIGAYGI